MRFALDDLANILLTMPLGFAGFLHFRNKSWAIFPWPLVGLALGLAAEFFQLMIPTRHSFLSDAINNGLGALFGAVIASLIGRRALEFFTGTASERRNIYLWMLVWALMAMLGPYDLGSDYISNFTAGLRTMGDESWNLASLYGQEWLRMAGFALIGALAIRLAVPGRRRRTVLQPISAAALILFFPVALHGLRLLTESHPPSINDLGLEIFGALAGAFASLLVPPILQAFSGFILFTVALIAAGLSPYVFSSWGKDISFQWIPFYDLCINGEPFSLYEPVLIAVSFAILGGFLRMSCPRIRQWHIAAYAMAFSAVIEFVQTFVPARTAGTGDIIVAGIGAWAGGYICAAVQSARLNDRFFLGKTSEYSEYVM
jgi:VanZ family protein